MQDKIMEIMGLNEKILDGYDDVHLDGDAIYHKNRGGRHGGGVALCVKDNLSCESLSYNDYEKDVECVLVGVSRRNHAHLTCDPYTDHPQCS